MRPDTHELKFHGGFLNRGFWLYVWEVSPGKRRRKLYYVGRTGDSSSSNAASPFARMGQHLGQMKNSNMLRTHLKKFKVEPEGCSLRLVAHGPILAETRNSVHHVSRRDRIAAMEKALECSMKEAGYRVMNDVKCRMKLEPRQFSAVRRAFASKFPKLKPV